MVYDDLHGKITVDLTGQTGTTVRPKLRYPNRAIGIPGVGKVSSSRVAIDNNPPIPASAIPTSIPRIAKRIPKNAISVINKGRSAIYFTSKNVSESYKNYCIYVFLL